MKLLSKALCIFLSALMMIYLIPNDVYNIRSSAEDVLVSANDMLSEDVADATAVGEVISKRTASSKTIRMSDGSYRLVQYASDVHYEDGGEWLEYDNSLSLSSVSSSGAVANRRNKRRRAYWLSSHIQPRRFEIRTKHNG